MLFDLAKDPHELHDLAPTDKARAGDQRDKLVRRARTAAAQAHTSTTRVFSAAEQEELQHLGYGQGKRPEPPKPPEDKH
jgi:hypothetical protein